VVGSAPGAEPAPGAPARAPANAARLYALTAALSQALTPEQVAEAVLAQGLAALGAAAGIVSLLTADGRHLQAVTMAGYAPHMVRQWERVPLEADLPFPEAVRTGRPVWLPSRDALFTRYPAIRAHADRVELQAWALVPLEVDGRAVGGLSVGFASPQAFSEEDRQFAVALAHQCAQALERARLFAAEHAARLASEAATGRLRFLADSAERLAATREPAERLALVAELAVPQLGDLCVVDLLEGEALRRVAISHRDPGTRALAWELERRFPFPKDAPHGSRRVLRTGQPDLVAHVDAALLQRMAHGGPEHLALLERIGMRSALAVPLQARGSLLGVLLCFACSPERRLGEEERALAQEFATHAALALDNARLDAEARAARERAERIADRTLRLQRMTAALSEAATPAQVAEAAVAQCVEALGARNGGVWELEGGAGGALALVHARGFTPGLLAHYRRLPLSSPAPAARVFRERAPEWLASRADFRARFPEAGALTAGEPIADYAAACLPLLAGGRSIGVLHLTFDAPRELDAEERAFLLSLATHCAHALERAHLLREAQEAVAVREEFLSIASHELKTPLTSLKLQLQSALQGRTPALVARSLERLERADRQVGRLAELVESMLDVSRIRTGRLLVELSDVDLAEAAREVVEGLGEQALRSGSALSLEVAARPRALVGRWDRGRVQQVLTNLTSNALKYGRGRPVRVRVEEGREGWARVVVQDGGIGIARAELASLFQPFRRAVSARHYGGLGLGLYISRQCAQAMGGTLEAESEEGVGSTFTLALPLAGPPAP
jgi:signal transduction histidine kinase